MSGVAGFPFQELNKRYLSQPSNDAASYGASIMRTKAANCWRCIGVYHLSPEQNRRRHNVFIDVLDEAGNRLRWPIVNWTWSMDESIQPKHLDKPDNEPAADIPINKQDTITLWVADKLSSDTVGNLHARHPDEGTQNTFFHHSFYVIFQRQAGAIITPPPPPIEPPTPTEPAPLTLESLAQRVAEIERRLNAMDGE